MIQANELRVGNYILKSLKSGQGRKIESKTGCQDIVRIFENTGSFNYEPITLTENWLLRFGFEKKVNNFGQWFNKGVYLLEYQFISDSYTLRKSINKDESILLNDKVKYVHQLQNLYFALTGTELTLKS